MKIYDLSVIFKGTQFEVTGEYIEEVSPIYYHSDGSGDPGTGPEFHIETIEFDGTDVTNLITLLFDENELIEQCIYEIEKNNFI